MSTTIKTVIDAKQRWWHPNFAELLRYKDLFYYLTWRDVKVRYKQTAIGVLWALLVPVITMLIFTVLFGYFAKIDSNGVPYPAFVFLGVLFWNFFSQSVTNASNSLVVSQDIIKKIYFPKVLLPAAALAVSAIDFFMGVIVLIGLMVYYHYIPGFLEVLALLGFVAMTYLTSLGIGTLLAAVNVKYRDVRYVVTFALQLLLFLTPVIYPVTIISEQYRWILYMNPMTGIIEGSRAVFFHQAVPYDAIWFALGVSIFFCIVGFLYFRKTERYFADVI